MTAPTSSTPTLASAQVYPATNGVTVEKHSATLYHALHDRELFGFYEVDRDEFGWYCHCQWCIQRGDPWSCKHVEAVEECERFYTKCRRCGTWKEPKAKLCLVCDALHSSDPGLSIDEALDAQPITVPSPTDGGSQKPSEATTGIAEPSNTAHVAIETSGGGDAAVEVRPGQLVRFRTCGHVHEGTVKRPHERGDRWFLEVDGHERCVLTRNIIDAA